MPYTQGVWKVKPGHADEFVAAWKEFAQWTAIHAAGSGWAKLLRDTNDENRFVSIGPWDDLGSIAAWRELDGWKERIGAVRQLLDGFEAFTLEPVVELD